MTPPPPKSGAAKQLEPLREEPIRVKLLAPESGALWLRDDGRRVLVRSSRRCMGDSDTTVELIDTVAAKRLLRKSVDSMSVAPSPTGQHFATLETGCLEIHDTERGQRAHELGNGVGSMLFSPNGRHLAASTGFGDEARLRLFELDSGQQSQSWPGWRASFSPDSRRILVLCDQPQIQVYEVGAGLICSIDGLERAASTALFSMDGSAIATEDSSPQSRRCWSATTGEQLDECALTFPSQPQCWMTMWQAPFPPAPEEQAFVIEQLEGRARVRRRQDDVVIGVLPAATVSLWRVNGHHLAVIDAAEMLRVFDLSAVEQRPAKHARAAHARLLKLLVDRLTLEPRFSPLARALRQNLSADPAIVVHTCLDWGLRDMLPTALDHCGLRREAKQIRALPPIRDNASALHAKEQVEALLSEAADSLRELDGDLGDELSLIWQRAGYAAAYGRPGAVLNNLKFVRFDPHDSPLLPKAMLRLVARLLDLPIAADASSLMLPNGDYAMLRKGGREWRIDSMLEAVYTGAGPTPPLASAQ